MERDTWHNWSGTEHARPHRIATPRTAEELATIVADAAAQGLHVKAVGAGHSFTGAAVTDGVLVRLDRLTGIVSVSPTEPDGALVTVHAGTRLYDLNRALWDRGLALANLGDIDVQSVAGAFSTGTHGTGAAFGGLVTQVRALEVVLADGSVARCSATENTALFEAARLGLGALGIITTVTLACVPAFALRAVEAPETLDATLDRLDEDRAGVDHFEFYWFPHTRRVLTKRNTRLPGDTPVDPIHPVKGFVDDELLSNGVFGALNVLGTALPASIPTINAITSRALSPRAYTERSYRVYASPRRVRFREMEYAVPVATLPDVLTEIDRWIEGSGFRVAFPIEVRFAAADDVWLSTANDRETAYVAVHQFHRRDHRDYFDAVERIARGVDGRPHWGKMHSRTYADLRPTYTHLDEFVAVRDKYDPTRVFDNGYLRRILGP
ncbi:FAD-binding protein [Rhodococcus triatomae]|uniref:L-gulonolactone oxidase n=1 Tax=Rhodococcus triatomae TaxID=300028 RepID=A0A1G7Z6V1_9NOCA|nr:D-arabinono-1,4-lactone oxidase [Rhodococcus triatomae]QNG18111.1 FAD-binding protein [Rhodococcus triatomae]QNG22219.1 FAD-binding protein [Rhodococcus triatomae]SDH04226.1 L-gulonolactone oxidase [Rhodococcus triatomae]